MTDSQCLVYVSSIKPTYENAKAIQRLTLQDVTAGRFKSPLAIANPNDHDKVVAQQQKLSDHPERYSGYTRGDELVAFMKQNDWRVADELPFATGFSALTLRLRRLLHLSPGTGQWGVFGLVASDDLSDNDRDDLLLDLLERSFEIPGAYRGQTRVVNIVLHDYDPVLPLAVRHGFIAIGKAAEAAGAPGLKQHRFQRLGTN